MDVDKIPVETPHQNPSQSQFCNAPPDQGQNQPQPSNDPFAHCPPNPNPLNPGPPSAFQLQYGAPEPHAVVAAGHEGVGGVAETMEPAGDAAASVPSNGMQQKVAANPNPSGICISMERSLKKTKIVQSVWCELCGVECNSLEMLNTHKSGKKHQKNLKKLEESRKVVNVAAEPAATVVVEDLTTVTEITSGESGQGKAMRSNPEDDLDRKRQKLVEGGTAVDSLRECTVCNVVCNSETVFKVHLAGQKHAAKVASALDGTRPMVGPNSNSNPHLNPDPNSNPNPDPNSNPNPNPNSDSDPNPDPNPNPNPNSNPNLNPDSDPNPNSITVDGATKKRKKKGKKTEVVQQVWCELCTVTCSSQEVLDRHKLGKRHMKNLEKLNGLNNAGVVDNPDPEAGTTESLLGEEAKTPGGEAKRKREASTSKTDLETKKQRLLECGITEEMVKVCTTCNVVCNSEVVYNFHVSGQKHATQLRKQSTEIAKAAICSQLVTSATVASNIQPEPVSSATMVGPEQISDATMTITFGSEPVSAATVTTMESDPISGATATSTTSPGPVAAATVRPNAGSEPVTSTTMTPTAGPQLTAAS